MRKWRKVVGERGDKVIFFWLDKLDHDLRKTIPRRKFLILKIWAIWSVGSDKTKCVYSFRQVNSERALYLVEILVLMDDHCPGYYKTYPPVCTGLMGYLCVFKFSDLPYFYLWILANLLRNQICHNWMGCFLN